MGGGGGQQVFSCSWDKINPNCTKMVVCLAGGGGVRTVIYGRVRYSVGYFLLVCTQKSKQIMYFYSICSSSTAVYESTCIAGEDLGCCCCCKDRPVCVSLRHTASRRRRMRRVGFFVIQDKNQKIFVSLLLAL